MKHILRNTFSVLTKKEKAQFRLFVLLDVVINIIDIASLALLLWIIRFYLQPDAPATSLLPAWLQKRDSSKLILLFFLLFGAKNIFAFLITKAQYDFSGRVASRISTNNLAHYQNAGYEEFVHVDSSVFVRKIAYQPFDFCQHVLSGLQQIITQSSLIIITILAILLFNAKLFLLLLLILLPPVILVFYFIRKKLAGYRGLLKSTNQRSFQYLMDALKGYVESNIYNRNNFFLKRFSGQRKEYSAYLFNSISIQAFPSRWMEIFAVLGLFGLIAIANWSGMANSESLITVGAFMAAAYRIIPGIVKITNASGQIRAYEFSLTDAGVPEKEAKQEERSGIHSVEFKNLSFHYGEMEVVKNLSFHVVACDFIAITGRSGKGKTTLLNLLLGFLYPSKGEVLINGVSIQQNSCKKFWPSVSYVRQQTFLIHDTIEKNITLEEHTSDGVRLQKAVAISGIDGMIKDFPEGLQKVITENGKNISGGQQQRIAIARAVYKNADLILLDEPFNELDEVSEIRMLEHFRLLSREGKIVLLITHNKKALDYCNKRIELDER